MKKLSKHTRRLKSAGQGMVEYAMLIFLVAIVASAMVLLLGDQLKSAFSRANSGLST